MQAWLALVAWCWCWCSPGSLAVTHLTRHSHYTHPPSSTHPSNPWFQLYDLYAREFIGLPVDIWALGVLLYLLAFGRLPFEGEAKLQVRGVYGAREWRSAFAAVQQHAQRPDVHSSCETQCCASCSSKHIACFHPPPLQVLNGRYAMPEGRPEPLRALIRDCLTVSPRQRPTIQQVLARLEALAPADLLAAAPGSAAQQLHQQQQPAAGASAAAAIASSNGGSTAPPPPLHTRIPSQGWADFGSDAGSAASPGSGANGEAGSGPHSRHHSGSLASWATFSPKRAAEVAVGAPAAVAASVGSFWSSFGEETPSDVQEPLVLATQQGGAAQQPQQQAAAQQPQQQAAAVGQPPRASPAQTPAPAPAAPRQAVAASAAAAGAGTAAVSPLSAGLARMSLGSTSPMPAQRQQPPSAQSEAAAPVPQPPAEGRGPDASDETQMLREHCRVLEQLLEVGGGVGWMPVAGCPVLLTALLGVRLPNTALLHCTSPCLPHPLQGKTAEIALLHKQAEQQAAEIRTLRQRALQAETAAAAASKDRQQPAAGQGSSMAASAVPAATAASTAASTPTSSRIGQDVPQLQVPGGSDSWISFGGGGSRDRDAPTPTLLQPATGSFHGSSGAAAAPAATPTPPHPTEEALRKRLDLSSKALVGTGTRASAGLLVSPYDEPQRQPPMRGSSSSRQPGAPAAGGAAMSSDASGLSSSGSGNGNGLHSLPVQLTPGASPLQQGTRSAPPSAKPSPTRTSSIDVPANADADSLQQPSSPKHSRPGSSLTGRSLSPTKGHKRNLTAPGAGFFEDLDPLA